MRRTNGRVRLVGALFALGLVAAACSSVGAAASGSGGMSLSIASPADGASVTQPFTLTFDSSVPIGDPMTGEHHVHLCFDGGSCDELNDSVIAYQDSVQVQGLSPGMHTIHVSLRNADHSDAGVSAEITVTVTGGAMGPGSDTGSSTGSTGSRGYGY